MRQRLFVTGGTGAIGRPLLSVLVERAEVDRLYVLVHRAPVTEGSPQWAIVRGDITAGTDLGLDRDDASALKEHITGIVHLAADTRFSAPLDECRQTNTIGMTNLLAFAGQCRRLDRVLVMSTTHVAGRRTGEILETDLVHEEGFVNAYEASKYEAELVARSQALLPIAVCRLSTVVGDSATGEIRRRGALHHAVLAMYAGLAPMVPGGEDSPVDLLASDYACRAIGFLATDGFRPGETWHLGAGTETLPAGELLDLTMESIRRYRPSWRRRAIERPVFVDLATFELFRRSVDEVGDAAIRASTGIISQFAPQLAFPKQFDDRRCQLALRPAGLVRPSMREVWGRVVRQLVQPADGTGDG